MEQLVNRFNTTIASLPMDDSTVHTTVILGLWSVAYVGSILT